jgi:hypothetical protein
VIRIVRTGGRSFPLVFAGRANENHFHHFLSFNKIFDLGLFLTVAFSNKTNWKSRATGRITHDHNTGYGTAAVKRAVRRYERARTLYTR